MNDRVSTLPLSLVGALAVGISTVSFAADIVVNSAADGFVDGDGLCTLREAIDNADTGTDLTDGDCLAGSSSEDENRVLLAPGLPPIQLLLGPLQVDRQLEIDGGPTRQIIDGSGGNGVLWFAQTQTAKATPRLLLRNLVLRNGQVNDASDNFCSGGGAGLCAASPVGRRARVVLDRVDFSGHQTGEAGNLQTDAFAGAALHVDGDSLELNQVRISGSRLSANFSRGGGLFFRGDRVTLADVDLRDNRVEGNSVAAAAMAIEARQISIGQISVGENVLQHLGGTVQQSSTIQLRIGEAAFVSNGLFELNRRTDGAGLTLKDGFMLDIGRAASAVGSPAFIGTNLLIDRNWVGALRVQDVDMTVVGSTMARNDASSESIVLSGGNHLLLNSSVLQHANVGSALRVEDSILRIDNSTVALNESLASVPGAIEAIRSDVRLRSTLLAGNAGIAGNIRTDGQSRLDVISSQFGDPLSEIDGVTQDVVASNIADLAPLSTYGCATVTGSSVGNQFCMLVQPLNPGSLAIDKGQSNGQLFDQRGVGYVRAFGNPALADIGAIENQPPSLRLLPLDGEQPESNGAPAEVRFQLQRIGDVRGTASVDWRVEGHGPSPAGAADFTPATWAGGTVTFSDGQINEVIRVYTVDDGFAETDEGYRVVLENPSNAQLGSPSSQTARILNDDALFLAPTLSLSPLEVDQPEGSLAFYSSQRFRVTRTQDTSGFCTYQLTIAGAGDDPIEADDLFDRPLGNTGTFQMGPGQATADFELRVAADAEFEGDEGFSVSLANLSGCFTNLNANQVFSTIRNDDSLFRLSADEAVKAEGDIGSTGFAYTLERIGPSDHTASVSWSTMGSGAQPASPEDFLGAAFPGGQITFPPGVISVPIVVQVAADTAVEPDEDFRIQLGNPRSGGSIDPLGDSRLGVIVNDDLPSSGDRIFANGFEQAP